MLYFKLKSLIYITIYNFKSFYRIDKLIPGFRLDFFIFSILYKFNMCVHFQILILTYFHEAEHHQ